MTPDPRERPAAVADSSMEPFSWFRCLSNLKRRGEPPKPEGHIMLYVAGVVLVGGMVSVAAMLKRRKDRSATTLQIGR